MAFAFDIVPFVGALPVRFGMSRAEVHRLLGPPDASHPIWDGEGTTDSWIDPRFNIGYDGGQAVNHVGFCPGGCDLALCGVPLWSQIEQPDPNSALLRLDPTPLEMVGILFYPALGISSAGYHDGDESQLSLTTSPAGTWDDFLGEGCRPDLSRYK